MVAPTTMRVNLRRDPDGADLVDEQHADGDHHRAGERLDDDAVVALLEDVADRAEQHALERRVGQRTVAALALHA